jgi:cytochrome c oxidase subunit 2
MKALAITFAGALGAAVAPAAWATMPERWQLNMTPGVTETARAAYEMHMIMLWICVAIGIVVFGAMFYAMFKFRKSAGAKADTSLVHSTKIEIVWTVIPVLILVVMAYPATRYLITMMDTRESQMTVKITGYQWKWRYEIVEYKGRPQPVNFISTLDFDSNKARMLGSGIDPGSVQVDGVNTYLLNVDRPLVLPTGIKVRFLLTADDVIHAWWVPAFGWKQDAIPGFVNEAHATIERPGVYRGQCAELCGRDHGFMPIVVNAVPQAEFEQWLAQQGGSLPEGTALAQVTSAAMPEKG